MRLKEQVAVITGAASGIGREIARRFAQEGATVVVADIDVQGGERLAKEIVDGGGKAMGLAMDVTDEQQVNEGVAAVVEAYGGVDVLVSNAGIQQIDSIVDLSYAEWRRVLAIHLDGGFLTTRAVMREMVRGGRGGSIIYMGSVHSKLASVRKAPYVSAKHALLGLARVVAKEGAEYGIRSNVICPGFIKTPLVEKQIPEQAQQLGISEEEVVNRVMLGDTVDQEFTTMQDVAEAAVFFASFPSNALTGQSLMVSHGWFMQ